MAFSREVVIEFDGERYRFTPSNKLLRRIDADLYPQTMFGILSQVGEGQVPLPAIACILANMLNAGGGNFDEDDVLQELYHDVLHNNGNGIKPLVEAIAECVSLPEVEAKMGNSSPPAKSKAGGRKQKEANRK